MSVKSFVMMAILSSMIAHKGRMMDSWNKHKYIAMIILWVVFFFISMSRESWKMLKRWKSLKSPKFIDVGGGTEFSAILALYFCHHTIKSDFVIVQKLPHFPDQIGIWMRILLKWECPMLLWSHCSLTSTWWRTWFHQWFLIWILYHYPMKQET